MSSILGILTGRISNQAVYQQLTAQIDTNLSQLTKLQTELSTGNQFQLPSENPVAAQQVISLQALLAKKQQAQSNVTSAQSFLSEADSAMTNINNLMSAARATAVGAMGSTVTAAQQQAAAQSIQETIQQLINAGNEQFEGGYLFAGSDTQVQPFNAQGNTIQYSGNDQSLSTYSDVAQLSQTRVPGSQVFGALSPPVGAGVNLDPSLTFQTPLSDLHLGQGVEQGQHRHLQWHLDQHRGHQRRQHHRRRSQPDPQPPARGIHAGRPSHLSGPPGPDRPFQRSGQPLDQGGRRWYDGSPTGDLQFHGRRYYSPGR